VRREKRVCRDHHCADALSRHHSDGPLKIGPLTHVEPTQLHAQPWSHHLDLLPPLHDARVVRFHEIADLQDARNRFQECLDRSCANLNPLSGDAGDVAAGLGEAGDEPGGHRVTGNHDDGHGLGRLLCGHRRRRVRSDDGVHVEADEIGHESTKPLALALGGAGLDDEVLSLDPAEVAEPLPEPPVP
jgi:hypothetical protein